MFYAELTKNMPNFHQILFLSRALTPFFHRLENEQVSLNDNHI